MKYSACGKEEFEEEDAKHISVKHGFENPLQYQYLASLERRIKALEDRIKLLEGKSSRYP
jgi:hypothetical protein